MLKRLNLERELKANKVSNLDVKKTNFKPDLVYLLLIKCF